MQVAVLCQPSVPFAVTPFLAAPGQRTVPFLQHFVFLRGVLRQIGLMSPSSLQFLKVTVLGSSWLP